MEPDAPQYESPRTNLLSAIGCLVFGLGYLAWGLLGDSSGRTMFGVVLSTIGVLNGWMYRRRMRRS